MAKKGGGDYVDLKYFLHYVFVHVFWPKNTGYEKILSKWVHPPALRHTTTTYIPYIQLFF